MAEILCPKCGSSDIALKDVRIGVAVTRGKQSERREKIATGHGECQDCGTKISIEDMQAMRAGRPIKKKPWWKFW